MKMTIETCPTENVPEIINNLHPLILHLVRMGKGRREQDKVSKEQKKVRR